MEEVLKEASTYEVDFPQVKDQEYAKRVPRIAAAGAHNILMLGSQHDV